MALRFSILGTGSSGNCALLATEGARVLVPACSRTVEAGMVIKTRSPRVDLSRKVVLELLASSVDLSTAPTLEPMFREYGADPHRFDGGETVEQPVKIDNGLYVRDYGKCVLCYKCVEACGTDAQNTFAIAVAGRGFDARVLEVTGNYGNVYVNVQPDDFIAAGIKSLDWFQVKVGDRIYRTVWVDLTLEGAAIARLYVSTRLDDTYAAAMAQLANAQILIVNADRVVGSTLPAATARQFVTRQPAALRTQGTATLGDESFGFRQLVTVGDVALYALGSIDALSREETAAALHTLSLVGLGAMLVALAGSVWLAQTVARPIRTRLMSAAAPSSPRPAFMPPRC